MAATYFMLFVALLALSRVAAMSADVSHNYTNYPDYGYMDDSHGHDDFDYSDDYDDKEDPCDPNVCKAPNCSCFGNDPSKKFGLKRTPQFVMLTFDDAITVSNIKSYLRVQGSRRNKANNCPITMTFFIAHEYNDYNLTNLLYRKGHEMAVHSISHVTDTEFWKTANLSLWGAEMNGMKEFLKTYGQIPESTINGQRAPFLQTAGDVTFKMLKQSGFLYDSSMPTRLHRDPPLWPYTLDYGFPQDCQIHPCPSESYEGVWVVPMVQLRRTGGEVPFFCSMVDACTPYPVSASDTKKFLNENFQRHYQSNKAPFPVFLHEAWLQHSERMKGYLSFIDELLQKDDVFFVSATEVVEYMRNPKTTEKYAAESCFSSTRPQAGDCSNPFTCEYKIRKRYMKSCVTCPTRYPWVRNG